MASPEFAHCPYSHQVVDTDDSSRTKARVQQLADSFASTIQAVYAFLDVDLSMRHQFRDDVQHSITTFVNGSQRGVVTNESEFAVTKRVQVLHNFFDAATIVHSHVGDVPLR